MRKTIWLLLSSFGILFALLSWFQESGIIPADIGSLKGILALFTGTVLYFIGPKYLD